MSALFPVSLALRDGGWLLVSGIVGSSRQWPVFLASIDAVSMTIYLLFRFFVCEIFLRLYFDLGYGGDKLQWRVGGVLAVKIRWSYRILTGFFYCGGCPSLD
ncbi:unnamed protein product [Cochlearia groenlandica]